MRQVNIRLTDDEYDALVKECGPAATVSGLATVILRQHIESSIRPAEVARSGRPLGAPVGGKKPGANVSEGAWRPFSKEDQTGRKRR